MVKIIRSILLCAVMTLGGCSALGQIAADAALGSAQKGLDVDTTLQLGGQSTRSQADLGIGQVGNTSTSHTEVELEGSNNNVDAGEKKYFIHSDGDFTLKVNEGPDTVMLFGGALFLGMTVWVLTRRKYVKDSNHGSR